MYNRTRRTIYSVVSLSEKRCALLLKIVAVSSNIIAALFALAAAALWYKSAKVRVALSTGGTGNPEMVVDGYAFVATTKEQAVWSRRAAVAAAIAAFFQAAGLIVSFAAV